MQDSRQVQKLAQDTQEVTVNQTQYTRIGKHLRTAALSCERAARGESDVNFKAVSNMLHEAEEITADLLAACKAAERELDRLASRYTEDDSILETLLITRAAIARIEGRDA